MKECRLLYSIYDMKQFLHSAFVNEINYSIHSLFMDGQKVFVLSFHEDGMLERFENEMEKPKPTMIGCIDTNDVGLTKESLQSMKEYIQELEKYERETL